MNKKIILVILVCIMLLFTSCTVTGEKTTPSSAPADSASAAVTTAAASASPSASAEPSASVDSGLTLDGIKQAAQAAGYKTEEAQDYLMIDEPKPVGSFNLIYEDDSTSAYIPVLEFKNADDAQTYAEIVNEAGYNLCVVNGKFLTMTSAQYGVTVNDKQTAVLEKLLQGKVMAYIEPSPIPLKIAESYAGAYLHIDAIYKAVDKLVNKSVLLYDKTAPEDERVSTAFVSFSPLSSGDLSFTSPLSEDEAQLDAVVQLWEMFGVTDMKLVHDAAHQYILTGKRAGLDTTFEIQCSFKPGIGALRLVDTDGGEVIELYEFVPLGGNKYAFQTLYSRAIVEYKDGKVMSLVYSLNKQDTSLAYDAVSDGIYEKGGVDEAWVYKAGKDSYEQFITYDGKTLKISADSFMGDRLDVEITVQ